MKPVTREIALNVCDDTFNGMNSMINKGEKACETPASVNKEEKLTNDAHRYTQLHKFLKRNAP